MLRKSTVLISHNNLHPVPTTFATSKTSSLPRPQHVNSCQRRQYAMISDGRSRHNHGSIHWPEKTSVNRVPTPYDIFNQKKGAKYSKETFYELVKLYHPDRHDYSNSTDGLSYATKLERYRLVIAANDILSDPVRRGAYDRYGAGWNGQPEIVTPREAAESSATWGSRGWSGGPEGPSQNATWEDWERWYQRDSEGPQSPRFVSNSAFVFLVVIFAAIGGICQVSRVGNYSMNFLDQRDALHSDISQDLMRRRKETINGLGGRDERIQSFLKQRAPVGQSMNEESYRRLLPAPKSSSGQGINDRPGVVPPKGNRNAELEGD